MTGTHLVHHPSAWRVRAGLQCGVAAGVPSAGSGGKLFNLLPGTGAWAQDPEACRLTSAGHEYVCADLFAWTLAEEMALIML